jgi:hypothetical protein
LRKDVTEEQLSSVLSVKSEVISVKIKDPKSKYDTNYATALFEKKDLLAELTKWANEPSSELAKLFKLGTTPFISYLQH